TSPKKKKYQYTFHGERLRTSAVKSVLVLFPFSFYLVAKKTPRKVTEAPTTFMIVTGLLSTKKSQPMLQTICAAMLSRNVGTAPIWPMATVKPITSRKPKSPGKIHTQRKWDNSPCIQ